MKISRFFVSILKLLPVAVIKPIAFKYVAGEDSAVALSKTKELNDLDIKGTLDILGESVFTEKDAESYTNQYIDLVKEIGRRNIASGVSVKPTAFGLCLSYEVARANFQRLLEVAKESGTFIRIDMEDSPFTDNTIKLYTELKESYPRIGIVYQAYLKRTLSDIEKHPNGDFNVRICKGIYTEPESIAYKSYQGVVDNYIKCLELLFEKRAFVGIATHDKVLVDSARELIKKKNVAKDKYEFQMLYGVLPDLRDQIKREGHPLRVYVPYGQDWYPYSIRRMYENPMIAFYVAKAVFVDSIVFLFRKAFN